MVKYCIILLGVCSLMMSAGRCQDIEQKQTPPPSPKSRPAPKAEAGRPKAGAKPATYKVSFSTASEDCYLRIDGEDKGSITKENPRSEKLEVGEHEITFESKVTGEILKYPFHFTRDMVKDGSYAYPSAIFASKVTQVAPRTTETRNPPSDGNAPPANDATQHPAKSAQDNAAVIPPPKPDPGGSSFNTVGVSKELATVNELVSNMVIIPGGSYSMGASGAKNATAHVVTIGPVKFSRYEVTQLEWENIMGFNRSYHQGCPQCPVENVSWEDADSFIRKMNQISHRKFRLPTEAEWEYVARHGLEAENGARASRSYLEKAAWFNRNSGTKTHEVGQKQPNDLGVYDMLGNVAEWCYDNYSKDYQDAGTNNPKGPAEGDRKVVRGGSFKDFETDIQPYERTDEKPSLRKNTIGFRLVMEVN